MSFLEMEGYMVSRIKCIQCQESYNIEESECWWDEGGYGYSTHLSRCPYCQQINIIKYKNDEWLKKERTEMIYD